MYDLVFKFNTNRCLSLKFGDSCYDSHVPEIAHKILLSVYDGDWSRARIGSIQLKKDIFKMGEKYNSKQIIRRNISLMIYGTNGQSKFIEELESYIIALKLIKG